MNVKKIIWVILFIAGLVAVRVFERDLFYDPFLDFFKEDANKAKFPSFDWSYLILNYLFRFGLNLFFSLLIIHSLFNRIDWTFQSFVIISVGFLVFFGIYLLFIYTEFGVGRMISFYARRMVIQPIMVLLLVPLLFYRKKVINRY